MKNKLAFAMIWLITATLFLSVSNSNFSVSEAYLGVADDIPLTPQNGGKSIKFNSLQVGDIILSTTNNKSSKWIRLLTGEGPISHAFIFVGNDSVIEALPEDGVTLSKLDDALSSATVAVAFRFPKINSTQQKSVTDYIWKQLGKKYDYWGAVSSAHFFSGNALHLLVSLGSRKNKFYCSELVLSAYQDAGIPLVLSKPTWQSPNDLVPLTWFGELEYIGHLKYAP